MKFYIGLVYGFQIGATLADLCSKSWNFKHVDELLDINHCTSIKVAVTFSFRDPVTLALPRLVFASNLIIQGAGVTEIKLDRLRSVGSLSIVDTSELTLIHMPKLKQANFLSIENARKLDFLEFRSGLNIVGDLKVKNTSLRSIWDIDVKDVASIVIENNPNLLKMPLPHLRKVITRFIIKAPNEGFFFNAPALEEVSGGITFEKGNRIDMPKLRTIHGNLRLSHLNTNEIDLPVTMVKGYLEVIDCRNLIVLTLPRLVNVEGWLYIFRNDALESIRLKSLETVGGKIHIHALSAYDIHLNQSLTDPKETRIVAKVICSVINKIFGPQLKNLICVSSLNPGDTSGTFLSLF